LITALRWRFEEIYIAVCMGDLRRVSSSGLVIVEHWSDQRYANISGLGDFSIRFTARALKRLAYRTANWFQIYFTR
jgi:hypothetical protein